MTENRKSEIGKGDNLEAQMDTRFGRCAWFVVVDTDTMEFEAFENTAAQQSGGAGSAAAQIVGQTSAEAIVGANYGPTATMALQAGGITMLQGAGMTVAQAAQAAANGQLVPVSQATVADKAGVNGSPSAGGVGMGGGMGTGRGMGTGQGRGMGRGMGMGQNMGQNMGGGMGMGQNMGWDEGYAPMGQPGPWGPMGPMAGYQPDPEQMRQYQLTMLRAQAQMLEQELDFVRNQIEYLENA